MVAIAFTVAFEGVEARLVEVQASVSAGIPSFGIVGLPDKAVSEARDRVRAAFNALSIAMPSRRVTVNLSPADLPKEGSHFDLPIALAVLAGALVVVGNSAWPIQRSGRVVAVTMTAGLAYTVFSEWLNTEVRRSWAYSDLMPVLPPLGTGLSPLLQWLVVPAAALWLAFWTGRSRTE